MFDDVTWLEPLLAFIAGLLLGRWSGRPPLAPKDPRAAERGLARVGLEARARMETLLTKGRKIAASKGCRVDTGQRMRQARALIDLTASRRAR